ncbi:NfeD family protein [Herbaspirillum sp. BH-1]|uniref:Membrane protein implicated in regulation of membrane protease activity n=1 Tax=Herbaspirillum frisingense TaxID=92645 RepID=A0ABU1P8J8_9BURK|nr:MULTISPECIES: NfeD family protein [Herbaspirillum]MDR6582230.1 membrane protein implicated in regulation of membrane protease activity [Herbaspirillum frisingense]PLY59250.1 NfeD family protein [Herbaspirillum sp. BH-1]
MSDWAIWWALAGGLLAAELFTGTFYLLMIALGLAAGGIVAWGGVPLEWQLLVAAIVGVAAVLALRRSRYGRLRQGNANDDPNLLLDIGQSVEVPTWQAQGSQYIARVPYRGAQWDVELLPGHHALPGPYVIREIRGSRLLVAPR